MKNLLLAVLLLLTAASCLPNKKNKDPEPDLAGTYQVSQLISEGVTYDLPSNGTSAVVIVTRQGDNQIDVRITSTENGSSDSADLPRLTIQKTSGREYDMLVSNTRIGSIDGTVFSLNYQDNTGQQFAIAARK